MPEDMLRLTYSAEDFSDELLKHSKPSCNDGRRCCHSKLSTDALFSSTVSFSHTMFLFWCCSLQSFCAGHLQTRQKEYATLSPCQVQHCSISKVKVLTV